MRKSEKLTLMVTLAVGTSLGGLSIVNAHHSAAPHFDISTEIEVTGTITEWKFINPHAYLLFDVTNADGTTTSWKCEGLPAASMRRLNFTDETFIEGMQITIFGNPARREDHACLMREFSLGDSGRVSFEDDLPANLVVGEVLDQQAVSTEHEQYLADSTPNFGGFWMANRGGPRGAGPRAEGGGMGGGGGRERQPPVQMTEAGQAANDAYVQIYDDPGINCGIANIIFGMTHNQNVNKFTQYPDRLEMIYGYMDFERTIYLDGRDFPANMTPSEGGYSIGTFEGDTLVVTTKGMEAGMVHPLAGGTFSRAATVVERFSYDAETNQMTREYSMTDPDYIIGAYTGTNTFEKSAQVYSPYNCEPTRDLSVLRPGSPEHEAELARIAAEGAVGGAQNYASEAADATGLPKWLLALGALVILLGGFMALRSKNS